MYGHLSSFGGVVGVTNALVDDLVDIVASPVVGALLSVLGVDQVFGLESGSGAQDAGAFTKRCHVKRNLA